MRHFILAILIFLPASQTLTANNTSEGEMQTITEKVSGLKKYDGFFTFYWSEGEGKIFLEVDKWNTDFLAVSYLSRGMGSNDVGRTYSCNQPQTMDQGALRTHWMPQ